jgi:hypothetical protein
LRAIDIGAPFQVQTPAFLYPVHPHFAGGAFHAAETDLRVSADAVAGMDASIDER